MVKPYFEHKTGRWMCDSETDALTIAEKHPGDQVYTYQRDKNGHEINIQPYWTPRMPDKNRGITIKHGRLIKK